jgi:hypothetical protein
LGKEVFGHYISLCFGRKVDMFRSNWRLLIGLVLLVGIVGCPATGPARPTTYEVTGTVMYNGAAVDGAVVSFSPKGEGHAATGTTDASGAFSLTTFESGDGAVPGSYAVTVYKTEGGGIDDSAIPEVSEEDPGAAYEAMEAMGAEGEAETEAKDLLPVKYKNPDTSGLDQEVTESGPNHFEFNLED